MNKPYDSGLIVGRFQTFHKGHQRLVETGLTLCDRLLILVGSAQEYGNDESRSRWCDVEDTKDTSEFIVNRGSLPISATMLRTMMVQDNRKDWMQWVDPRLHKMYDRIRTELMTVSYYQDMAKIF